MPSGRIDAGRHVGGGLVPGTRNLSLELVNAHQPERAPAKHLEHLQSGESIVPKLCKSAFAVALVAAKLYMVMAMTGLGRTRTSQISGLYNKRPQLLSTAAEEVLHPLCILQRPAQSIHQIREWLMDCVQASECAVLSRASCAANQFLLFSPLLLPRTSGQEV